MSACLWLCPEPAGGGLHSASPSLGDAGGGAAEEAGRGGQKGTPGSGRGSRAAQGARAESGAAAQRGSGRAGDPLRHSSGSSRWGGFGSPKAKRERKPPPHPSPLPAISGARRGESPSRRSRSSPGLGALLRFPPGGLGLAPPPLRLLLLWLLLSRPLKRGPAHQARGGEERERTETLPPPSTPPSTWIALPPRAFPRGAREEGGGCLARSARLRFPIQSRQNRGRGGGQQGASESQGRPGNAIRGGARGAAAASTAGPAGGGVYRLQGRALAQDPFGNARPFSPPPKKNFPVGPLGKGVAAAEGTPKVVGWIRALSPAGC